ncbi:hypothetical protein H6G89_24265 [Oscillatoria sp. FACHB-1407]|uniref:hypothetical protein n=1 Tax=Oscillatoria sp. FACHB-1407 TaxID=2692847 RepID=UPI001689AE04|nr:hypothetical protein [Oscillatoria sp. FACHB-1407]MBD2464120.1 hypothetical protein [Oscillatoria sp. FACHB-1407]
MVDAILERAWALKQSVTDFVFDAEGELAEALETYVADYLKRGKVAQDLIVDTFLVEGRIGEHTPLDLFEREQATEFTDVDHQLLQQWRRTFTGLFAIETVSPDGIELMNWLTAKHYTAKLSQAQASSDMAIRLKPGEIVLARLAPIADDIWMFSTTFTLLGKLGKPKLAVAIGNFKEHHKPFLYADAPDLLEAAWGSVESYHHAFVEFFGGDEVTLPGYQLNQKMDEFREFMLKRQFTEAGLEEPTSLEDLMIDIDVDEADLDEAELNEAAQAAGVDAKDLAQALKQRREKNSNNGSSKGSSKMALPEIQLPDTLKKAEQVTVLTHPRWGQIMLPNYEKFKAILANPDGQPTTNAEPLVRHYLETSTITPFVWQRLAQHHPEGLEQVLQTVLDRPNFQLEQDLSSLLQEYGKPVEPELPEIASVPLHLHTLFDEAVKEVNKSKPKGKEKAKKAGFGAR